jgi:hypothetical protein
MNCTEDAPLLADQHVTMAISILHHLSNADARPEQP